MSALTIIGYFPGWVVDVPRHGRTLALVQLLGERPHRLKGRDVARKPKAQLLEGLEERQVVRGQEHGALGERDGHEVAAAAHHDRVEDGGD